MFTDRSAYPTPDVTSAVPGTYIVQRQPDPTMLAAMLAASGGKLEDLVHAADLLKQRRAERAERAAHAQQCEEQRIGLAYLNHAGTL